MIKLSVNVNKIATLRNSRGGEIPSLKHFTRLAIESGVHGITIHPRPDQRHIKYKDIFDLKEQIPPEVEFNIEGYPNLRYLSILDQCRPTQATLVPDDPKVLTSDKGWNLEKNFLMLQKVIGKIKKYNIRVSLFLDPDFKQILYAKELGADRIEFYTGPFAKSFQLGEFTVESSFAKFNEAAIYANYLGLGINAGHDLNISNLQIFKNLHGLMEVSIGHSIVSESIEFGWQPTLRNYLDVLN